MEIKELEIFLSLFFPTYKPFTSRFRLLPDGRSMVGLW